VLREIKKQNSQMPVILIGEAAPELSRLAAREGALAYLPIPSDDFQELMDTIERALTMREVVQQTDQPPAPPVSTTRPALDDAALASSLRQLIESSRGRPLAETMQLLLRASAATMEAEHSVVLLMQGENTLQLDSALGFSDQAAAARDFVRHVGDAFASRVANERQTLIDQAPTYEGEVECRFIGAPLFTHDHLLGVLIVYPIPVGPVEPERVTWLEAFAAEGALAIQFARLNAENERLSPNDPLTGVLKRSVFLDLADHEFRRSWRYNEPICAIIVDVDGMREINSSGSRDFGDRVLRAVANTCRSTVRSIDLVGRYENDSFAILLLMTDRSGAKSVAERLRLAIAAIDMSDARGPVRVTATLGVCAYPREGSASIFDLLSVSAEAQRAARRSGPNRIVYV
jgi:diguanylate cyclase (GGDEF)-like protein